MGLLLELERIRGRFLTDVDAIGRFIGETENWLTRRQERRNRFGASRLSGREREEVRRFAQFLLGALDARAKEVHSFAFSSAAAARFLVSTFLLPLEVQGLLGGDGTVVSHLLPGGVHEGIPAQGPGVPHLYAEKRETAYL